ncbi:bifunctional UDP-sugar hydrolase/5'-nucleotidase [Alteribacillus sp. JSM 102045]|uniref:bifunctional metallophosphatase/5'-nucleotidase n=1 Tax=Alteribacillus sp. JSM 102045 TaxID=1562101 RepID=UPI0035C1D224
MGFCLSKSKAAITAAALFLGFSAATAEAAEEEVTIIHTNDIHASIDDFGKLAAFVEEKKNEDENVIYLDAGDISSGNPVVDLNEGKPIIDLLNQVGLDAMTVGNHDFDYGQEAFEKNMGDSEFPWLSANTKVEREDVPFEEPEAYEVIEAGNVEIGILGLTQAPPATAPDGIEGLSFEEDYAQVAIEYQDIKEDTDIFVGLNHIGYDDDRALAEDTDIFDVIVGAHSHTALEEPEEVNGTSIAQTGADLNNIGEVNITVDTEKGEVTNIEGQLHDVDELEEIDEDVQASVESYQEEADELLSEEVGETKTGLSREGRNEQDVPLGNFWTDAMRDSIDADIAFTNNGGIRASIDEGTITAGDFYEVEPFGNEVMKIHMTGESIEEVIEYSYSRYNAIDLQASGIGYTIYYDEEDDEYVDAEILVDGEPIDPEKTYVVAVNDYIGTGGDGYEFNGEVVQDNAGYVTNAMLNYAETLMEEKGVINYESEGRIALEEYQEEEEEEETPQKGKGIVKECIVDEVHEVVGNGKPQERETEYNRGQLISMLNKYRKGKETDLPEELDDAVGCIDESG